MKLSHNFYKLPYKKITLLSLYFVITAKEIQSVKKIHSLAISADDNTAPCPVIDGKLARGSVRTFRFRP